MSTNIDLAARMPQPIFILGLNKSGTSLLYLCLSKHPQLSAIRTFKQSRTSRTSTAMLEMSQYQIGEGQKIPSLIPKLSAKANGGGRWAAPEFFDQFRLTKEDVASEDREAVIAAYRSAMLQPELRLCEKSPPNLIRARYLQALFPDATFVAIIRDPLANVAANGKKRTKWGGVHLQAQHWNQANTTFFEDRPHLQRCLTIRYEDFVVDPAAGLRDVCDFCELPFAEQMLDDLNVAANVNDALISLLTVDDIASIRSICEGAVTTELGYSLAKAA